MVLLLGFSENMYAHSGAVKYHPFIFWDSTQDDMKASIIGKGKGWSSVETIVGYRAYVTAWENPRAGSRKKKEVFVGQILQLYKKYVDTWRSKNGELFYNDRIGEVVVQRFWRARCKCQKFEGIISSIQSMNPTGSLRNDETERAAVAIYIRVATVLQMYLFIREKIYIQAQCLCTWKPWNVYAPHRRE